MSYVLVIFMQFHVPGRRIHAHSSDFVRMRAPEGCPLVDCYFSGSGHNTGEIHGHFSSIIFIV